MEIQEVKERIIAIADTCKTDDEAAHSLETSLFLDFVGAVKDDVYQSKKQMAEVATELLKVKKIKYSRWAA